MSESFRSENDRSHYDKIAYAIEPEFDEIETPMIDIIERTMQTRDALHAAFREHYYIDEERTDVTGVEYETIEDKIAKNAKCLTEHFQAFAEQLVEMIEHKEDNLSTDEAIISLVTLNMELATSHTAFLRHEQIDDDPVEINAAEVASELSHYVDIMLSSENGEEYYDALEDIGSCYARQINKLFPL